MNGNDTEPVQATSGTRSETFVLAWDDMRWSSGKAIEESAFPFIAEVRGKRYELYSDGRFDEEEIGAEPGDGRL